MLLLLAAQAADPAPPPPAPTAIEAERAFAADALTLGTWASFRKWAAPNATMFDPQPVNPITLLRDRREPALPLRWSPAASYLSCDGASAANTGAWQQGAANGFFATIWARSGDGWRWIVEGGDTLRAPRAGTAVPGERRAACSGTPPLLAARAGQDEKVGQGASLDNTLQWRWIIRPDGARRFTVSLWNGARFDTVIDDRVAAPPPRPVAAPTGGTSPAGPPT